MFVEYFGMLMGELIKYVYVCYSEVVVEYLFVVVSGLDLVVIGE